jgi:hypothetical protein
MSTLDELRSQALELPPAHRAGLARDLLLSLESGEASTDSKTIDAEWADEIHDRAEAVASGDFAASDWRESVDRLRNELAQRRSS